MSTVLNGPSGAFGSTEEAGHPPTSMPVRVLLTEKLDTSSALTQAAPEETPWAGLAWVHPEQGLVGDSMVSLSGQTQG